MKDVGAEPRYETDLLAELISARHDVLAQLLELSRRQLELIGESDMSRLFVLLSSKQKLLERVQQLDRRLDPFRQQAPESRVWRSIEARQQARQQAQRCEALLQEIKLVENQGAAELTTLRDQTTAQLEIARAAEQARTAYGGGALAQQGGRLDLTSER